MPGESSSASLVAELDRLVPEVKTAITACESASSISHVRAAYFGRSDGKLTAIRKSVGGLPSIEEKKELGKIVNAAWGELEALLEERNEFVTRRDAEDALAKEALDLSLPAAHFPRGDRHPITRVQDEIREIFGSLGYLFVEGPEVEYDRYNFTFVNMPPEHPSRDTQDTYFIDDVRLLRTQTSSVQIRAMRQFGAPMQAIVVGRCFRRDNDATHAPIFYQAEGICIDEDISLADLKGTLLTFMRGFFGKDRSIRLRPHHFPFTEPSFEIDISCMKCEGSGCSLCRQSGWIEVLGSGMIHPTVLENGGIDPSKYRGFAFGVGLERLAMLKYNIQHIKLLYENDLRFLHPVAES